MGTQMRSKFFSTVLWSAKSTHHQQPTPTPLGRQSYWAPRIPPGDSWFHRRLRTKNYPGERDRQWCAREGVTELTYMATTTSLVTNTIPMSIESMFASFSIETELWHISFLKEQDSSNWEGMLFNFRKETQSKMETAC